MRPVMVLQHGSDVPVGLLGEVLIAREVPHVVVRLHEGEPVPVFGDDDWAGIVSLGGEMGAYDTFQYPFLVAEKTLLAAATGAGVPVLGICLGSQLLADAVGGRAYRARQAEARVVVFESDGVIPDPVLGQLDAPQLTFHRDTFALPPEAKLLRTSNQYPQAFRVGRSIGIQTHPEISSDTARDWFGTAEGKVMLNDAGANSAKMLADLRTGEDRSRDAATRFFSAWLDEVLCVADEESAPSDQGHDACGTRPDSGDADTG